jgi:hypothetical protein
MVGEVLTVGSFDTHTDIPIVSADLLRWCFKLADFEAIKVGYLCRFIAL